MSAFWSIFVTVVTLATILAAFLLLHLTRRSEPLDGANQDKGHEFDGIRELETPLPRWWYWMFVGSMVFALGYLVLFPGLGTWAGTLGWTSAAQHDNEQAEAQARYGALFASLAKVDLATLSSDPKARKIGQRLFGVHCAQCHGEGGRGNFGFPNLSDADWQWGSTPAAIAESIRAGRNGVMPAWIGALGGERGVSDVAAHVLALGRRPHDAAAAARGAAQFQAICTSCHGADGRGNDALGAPDLTDGEWLYGGSEDEIAFSIRNGRNGQMPAHEGRLDADTLHVLTAYVMGLNAERAARPDPS
jgi:cytochrome c oxidase cbb3-type subunit 3